MLKVTDGGETYLPAYDAMGNVHAMIKGSDGSVAAAYEYDAFGRTIRESGPYAAQNPFRYSTKYTDETGLIYYGLRYYHPSLGRFINRDPIGERGGLNLYAFTRNNGVNNWDYLGLSEGGRVALAPFNVTTTRLYDPWWQTSLYDEADWWETFNASNEYVFYDGGGSGGGSGSDDVVIALPPVVVEEQKGNNGNVVPPPVVAPVSQFVRTISYADPNNAEREALRKECQNLADQMAGIGTDFARKTLIQGPSNPMSAGELRGEVASRARSNFAGTIDALVYLTPAGPFIGGIGFLAASVAADQTLSNDPSVFRAGLTGALYGATASGYLNNVSTATTGRSVLGQAGQVAVKRAGFVGVAVTGVDVLGVPLLEYESRNRTPARENSSSYVQLQWESVVGPTLKKLSEQFSSKGCAEVLNGN